VILTHLVTNAFLYQRNHPEDGHVSGQNMLLTIIQ